MSDRLAPYLVDEILTISDDKDWAREQLRAGRFHSELFPLEDGTIALAITVGDESDPKAFELATSPDPDDHFDAGIEQIT